MQPQRGSLFVGALAAAAGPWVVQMESSPRPHAPFPFTSSHSNCSASVSQLSSGVFYQLGSVAGLCVCVCVR